MTASVFDRIRTSCAAVAGTATEVAIREDRIGAFVASLDLEAGADDDARRPMGREEAATAFVLALDAVNFGSGYFPALRKRPGLSGSRTIAASLRDLVADTGALTVDRLAAWTVDDAAATFGQVLDGGPAHELMRLYTQAWHDLAAFVDRFGGGSFTATVGAADGSAATMVELLDTMPFFHDVHGYPPHGEVLFYKRAQITVQDLWLTFAGEGPGRFTDRRELTMFADNLVPHVLRVDGVLAFSDDLLARIEAVDDIAIGSPAEIEIRACGVHAVELIREELARLDTPCAAGDLDNHLWRMGGLPRYKAVARHRTRCVYY